MYNLIIGGADDAWEKGHFALDESRFLEHTDPALREKFLSMTPEVAAQLRQLPTIFAYELGGGPSRVGWITEIRNRQGEIRIAYRFDDAIPPLDTRQLSTLTWEFDLNKNEFYRTHWAIKDVDLPRALKETGLLPGDPKIALGEADRAAPTRREIIDAGLRTQNLPHAGIDQLLLEIGINDIPATREAGSLRDRAIALTKFAIDNPDRLTADDVPLASYLVKRFPRPEAQDFRASIATAMSMFGSPPAVEQPIAMPIPVVPAPPVPIHRVIFSPPAGAPRADLVAVMMPFEASFNDVYAAIRAACSAAGLDCQRGDDIWTNDVIMQDVYDLIFQSSVVVSDFSGRNPNVFYETGIAHTLNKPVVPLVQVEADVPFDLRHFRHLRYLNNGEGRAAMTEKLTERLCHLSGKGS